MVDREKLDRVISKFEEELVPLLEYSLDHRTEWTVKLSNDGIIAVSNLLAAIEMYRSGIRLEEQTKGLVGLTKNLVWLTVVLAALTAALLFWQAFHKGA